MWINLENPFFIYYWYYLSFWKFRNFYNLSIFSKIKWWSDRQLIESNRIWMLLNPLWTFINFVSQPIFFDYCSYSDTVKIFLFYCLSASGWLQWCWWQHHVDDLMMVTDIRCWLQNTYVHQNILSPTSVNNIDVTSTM